MTAAEVQAFANALRRTLRYRQDNLRDGIMLAWRSGLMLWRRLTTPAAGQYDLNFIRLDMIRIDSLRFREHVAHFRPQNADYQNFLTFVQPPRVEVGYKRIAPRTYRFNA